MPTAGENWMKPDFENHRRVLLVMYRRYLRAERACRLAQREALTWFPARTRPSVRPIGDPGSRVRRLYERRNKLLAQLTLAHQELNESRRQNATSVRFLALFKS